VLEGHVYALEEWAKNRGLRDILFGLSPPQAPGGPGLQSSSSSASLSNSSSSPNLVSPTSPASSSKDPDFFMQYTRQSAQLLQLTLPEIRQAKEVVTKFPALNQTHFEKLLRMMIEFDKDVTMQHMALIIEFAKIRKKRKADLVDPATKVIDYTYSPKLVVPPGRPLENIPIPEYVRFGFEIEVLALTRMPTDSAPTPSSAPASSAPAPATVPRSTSFQSSSQHSSIGEELSSLVSAVPPPAFPNNPLQIGLPDPKPPLPKKPSSNFSFFHQVNGE